MEQWSHWYTPAHVMGGWRGRLARERSQAALEGVASATNESAGAELVPIAVEAAPTTGAVAIDFGKLEQLALF